MGFPWKSFGFMEYVILFSWIAIFEQNTTKINCINRFYDFLDCYHFQVPEVMFVNGYYFRNGLKKMGQYNCPNKPLLQRLGKKELLSQRYNKDFTNSWFYKIQSIFMLSLVDFEVNNRCSLSHTHTHTTHALECLINLPDLVIRFTNLLCVPCLSYTDCSNVGCAHIQNCSYWLPQRVVHFLTYFSNIQKNLEL